MKNKRANRFYYEQREQNPKKRGILVFIDLHHLKKKREPGSGINIETHRKIMQFLRSIKRGSSKNFCTP
ncbi:hypothetical protein ES707_04981 [subsurface metagenome]